jgi:hypothetical protein
MPAKNSVRGNFGAEGSGKPFYNPWRQIASPLFYVDAQFQDQTSINVPDLSGNSRNFQVNTGSNAATVHKTDSKGNKYFDLTASALVPSTGADYFPFSTASTYTQVTYAMWTRVKPNSSNVAGSGDWRTLTRTITNGGHHVIVQDDGSQGAKIGFWDGTFQTDKYHIAEIGNSTAGLQTSGGGGTGNWHFMVVKYQAATPQMQIFINDQQSTAYATATSTITPAVSPLYNSTGGWPGHISGCCSATNPTSQFWGDIAAFAAYNGFVSSTQLLRLYNETKHFFQPSSGVAKVRLMDFSSGAAFSEYITTDYEYPATAFAVTSGSLVTGLSLNTSTGLVSGTATGSSTTFTVQVTFSNGYTTSQVITHNSASLYAFTSATFTSGGVTGSSGPNLAQSITGLGSPSWASNTAYFNMTTNGIQRWTVPAGGTYTVDVYGAQGGNGGVTGGYGAQMRGVFTFTQGQIIQIMVGQQGVTGYHSQGGNNAGGGGATYVIDSSNNILVIAGGGGGGYGYGGGTSNGISASTSTTGNNGAGGISGGSGGNAGSCSNSGCSAGWSQDGANPNGSNAYRFLGGGVGGGMHVSWGDYGCRGGFGGGGGAGLPAGGGAGYSGGGGGTWSTPGAGGGGGSINNGTSPYAVASARAGAGQVIITKN